MLLPEAWRNRPGSPAPGALPAFSASAGIGASVGDAAARLEKVGLLLLIEDGKARLEEPLPGSPFEGLGRTFDFYTDTPVEIASIALPRGRMPKEVFYLPAVLAVVLVILVQRRRAAPSLRGSPNPQQG